MRQSRYNVWVERDGGSVLFSGMSGKLIVLMPGEREAVEQYVQTGDWTALGEERARELVEARALVADSVDELGVLDARFKKAKHNAARLGLTIVTSLGCNFDCPYCYEAKHPAILSDEVHDAVVGLVDDSLPRLSTLGVTWMGGEPLVGKRSLLALSDALIARCDAKGVQYGAGIITNGWHLSATTCRELAERRVAWAQVTLDGPPDVHDRMRPLVGGGSTFWRIVENLHNAVEHLSVSLRINIDAGNLWRTEELLQILVKEGLTGKLAVAGAPIGARDSNPGAPSASYGGSCYRPADWAQVELEIDALVAAYGFGGDGLPAPIGVPCTAVTANEIIVGAEGEIWKCWEQIGNGRVAIGNIRDYRSLDGALLSPWLEFDPITDSQCSTCIALPGCMGGCLQHTLAGEPRDSQCSPFRFNYRRRVERAAALRAGSGIHDVLDLGSLPYISDSRSWDSPSAARPVPVAITSKRPVHA